MFVESALNRQGRMLPVLADTLKLTVGGTLSVGAYGTESLAQGAQVFHVTRLKVIKPTGEAVWCSAEENKELFQFMLAGQGRLGFIEAAVMKTMPYKKLTTLFCYEHRDLDDIASSLKWLADEEVGPLPEIFKAYFAKGRYWTVFGERADSLRAALSVQPPMALRERKPSKRLILPWYRFGRSLAVALWVRCYPGHRRLWSDYVMDHAALEVFLSFLQKLIRDKAFGGCLKSVYMLGVGGGNRGGPELPFEAGGPDHDQVKFGVGLYSMIPKREEGRLIEVKQVHTRCLQKCLELGGRPYLYGWHETLTPELMRQIYGPPYDRMCQLRDELDPNGIFQRGKLL
jgi:FAD/FMN-containing dehydrogenase